MKDLRDLSALDHNPRTFPLVFGALDSSGNLKLVDYFPPGSQVVSPQDVFPGHMPTFSAEGIRISRA